MTEPTFDRAFLVGILPQFENPASMNRGGNAQLMQFMWLSIAQQLRINAENITAANLAIQKMKTDKPDFVMDFLRKQKAELRVLRSQLNLWMQRNQIQKLNLDGAHEALRILASEDPTQSELDYCCEQLKQCLSTATELAEQSEEVEQTAEEREEDKV